MVGYLSVPAAYSNFLPTTYELQATYCEFSFLWVIIDHTDEMVSISPVASRLQHAAAAMPHDPDSTVRINSDSTFYSIGKSILTYQRSLSRARNRLPTRISLLPSPLAPLSVTIFDTNETDRHGNSGALPDFSLKHAT